MPQQQYPNINMPSTGMGPIGRRFLQSQEQQGNQFSVPPAMMQQNVPRAVPDMDLPFDGHEEDPTEDSGIMASFIKALLMRLIQQTPDTDTQAMDLFGGDGGPEPAESQMYDQKRVPY